MNHVETRLKELKAFLAAEEKSKNPSKLYINDLKVSIESCKRQLKNVGPGGISIINGAV